MLKIRMVKAVKVSHVFAICKLTVSSFLFILVTKFQTLFYINNSMVYESFQE